MKNIFKALIASTALSVLSLQAFASAHSFSYGIGQTGVDHYGSYLGYWDRPDYSTKHYVRGFKKDSSIYFQPDLRVDAIRIRYSSMNGAKVAIHDYRGEKVATINLKATGTWLTNYQGCHHNRDHWIDIIHDCTTSVSSERFKVPMPVGSWMSIRGVSGDAEIYDFTITSYN